MSRFVLIHGAWHGSWCWDKVVPFLEERGHSVIAPDLPLTQGLDAYVETVVGALEAGEAQSILVGHSLGGAAISQAAEVAPERVERLVYVTAIAPLDGESVYAVTGMNIATALRDNVLVDDDGMLVVRPEVIRDAFYHDCSDEDIAMAIAKFRVQGPAALDVPLALTPERYGKVPKQYIECIEDQAIHIHQQRVMARRVGCTTINSMSTSHSPFFAAPAQLAAHLATVGIKDARKP